MLTTTSGLSSTYCWEFEKSITTLDTPAPEPKTTSLQDMPASMLHFCGATKDGAKTNTYSKEITAAINSMAHP
jgi:hypothetical protein